MLWGWGLTESVCPARGCVSHGAWGASEGMVVGGVYASAHLWCLNRVMGQLPECDGEGESGKTEEDAEEPSL